MMTTHVPGATTTSCLALVQCCATAGMAVAHAPRPLLPARLLAAVVLAVVTWLLLLLQLLQKMISWPVAVAAC